MKNNLLKKALLIDKLTIVFNYVYRYVVWQIKVMSYRANMSTL